MTPEDRKILIEKVTADMADTCRRDSHYLWSILKKGFKGYDHFTDAELLQDYEEKFGEPF